MDWKAMDEALSVARKKHNKGDKGTALGLLLREAGISSATVRGYTDAIWKIEAAIRLRCAKEQGIVPGRKVMFDGQERTVHNVNTEGYILLRGVRGAFHPLRFI